MRRDSGSAVAVDALADDVQVLDAPRQLAHRSRRSRGRGLLLQHGDGEVALGRFRRDDRAVRSRAWRRPRRAIRAPISSLVARTPTSESIARPARAFTSHSYWSRCAHALRATGAPSRSRRAAAAARGLVVGPRASSAEQERPRKPKYARSLAEPCRRFRAGCDRRWRRPHQDWRRARRVVCGGRAGRGRRCTGAGLGAPRGWSSASPGA